MPQAASAGIELLATAVLMLDAARRVTYANPAAENLFELAKKHLVGHRPDQVFTDAAGLDRRDRQGGPGRRDLHRAGARAHGRRQVEAPSHVHGVAGRHEGSHAAARVPAHRPAAEDRPRGAPERAAAGEPRAHPESRARDPESARRHPRRRAAPRARARPAAAHRVHAGGDRRGRPPAVARQPAADAAPAADVPAHEHPRNRLARAKPRAGRVSARRRGLRFRHQPAGIRRRSGAAHAGDAQHRPQRGAGPRSHDGRPADPPHDARRALRDARARSAAGSRWRSRSRTTARAYPSRYATGSSIRSSRGAKAAAASGSRWRRRSSRSTPAPSNAKACRDARCSPCCCRSNSPQRATRHERAPSSALPINLSGTP